MKFASLAEKLDHYSIPEPMSGCYLWIGALTAQGYGELWWRGGPFLAHRLAYEIANGPIPTNLTIDHLCRNRACIRPSHLEAVTMRENMRRGIGPGAINITKTHCPSGHPYDEANTHMRKGKYGTKRVCRACARLRAAEFRRRAAA